MTFHDPEDGPVHTSPPPVPPSQRWPALAGWTRPRRALAAVVAGVGLAVAVIGLLTGGHSAPAAHALGWLALYVLGVVLIPLTRLVLTIADAASPPSDPASPPSGATPPQRQRQRQTGQASPPGQPAIHRTSTVAEAPTSPTSPTASTAPADREREHVRPDRTTSDPGDGNIREQPWLPQREDDAATGTAGPPRPRPSAPPDRGWRLLDDPICPRCGTDQAIIADYYCDHCDHEWTIEPGEPWPDLVIDPDSTVPPVASRP